MCNIGIIDYLKIKHPNTKKISSIFKSVFKSVIRFDSSGCQYFIGNPGYFAGFEKSSRNIFIECWPRQADAGAEDSAQYEGWPVIINQMDNAYQTAEFRLPKIHINGILDPVVKVLDAKTGKMVYTVRIIGREFTPVVPGPGAYDVMIGEPDLKMWKTVESLIATPDGLSGNEITINFPVRSIPSAY